MLIFFIFIRIVQPKRLEAKVIIDVKVNIPSNGYMPSYVRAMLTHDSHGVTKGDRET